jgi:hypothetical protein
MIIIIVITMMIIITTFSTIQFYLCGVRVPTGAGNFSLHHRVRTGSGAHPPSYPMGTTGSFPGGKAELHSSQYAFMTCCSVKAQGQFYILPYIIRKEKKERG